MFETKHCRVCGSKVKVDVKHVGYDDQTGEPVSKKLRYCPMLSDSVFEKAYQNGTLRRGGYYHDHFLEEVDDE